MGSISLSMESGVRCLFSSEEVARCPTLRFQNPLAVLGRRTAPSSVVRIVGEFGTSSEISNENMLVMRPVRTSWELLAPW